MMPLYGRMIFAKLHDPRRFDVETIAAADVSQDGRVSAKVVQNAQYFGSVTNCKNMHRNYIFFGCFCGKHSDYTCGEVKALNDTFVVPEKKFSYDEGDAFAIIGDNFDTNGSCQAQCIYYSAYNTGGPPNLYRCRTKKALSRYRCPGIEHDWQVDSRALNGVTCSGLVFPNKPLTLPNTLDAKGATLPTICPI